MTNFACKEIDRVLVDFEPEANGYKPSIKVFGLYNNTKQILVTVDQLKAIRAILAEGGD